MADRARESERTAYLSSLLALRRLLSSGAIGISEFRKAEAALARRHSIPEGSLLRPRDLIARGRESVHRGKQGGNDHEG